MKIPDTSRAIQFCSQFLLDILIFLGSSSPNSRTMCR